MIKVHGFEFTPYKTNIIQIWDEEKDGKELSYMRYERCGIKLEKAVANGILDRLRKTGVVYIADETTGTQNCEQIFSGGLRKKCNCLSPNGVKWT